jgi:hypothetical protein
MTAETDFDPVDREGVLAAHKANVVKRLKQGGVRLERLRNITLGK